MSISHLRALSAASLLVLAGVANAANFNGTFTKDQDIAFFKFTAGSTNFSVKTTSYASGGFDPTIVLYDNSGQFITSLQPGGALNYDGDYDSQFNPMSPAEGTLVDIDPTTGFALDSFWDENYSYNGNTYGDLTENATYYLALIVGGNSGPATSLADPFGWENLTGNPSSVDAQGNLKCDPSEPFCAVGLSDPNDPSSSLVYAARTGAWALEMVNTSAASEVSHDDIHALFGGGGTQPPPPPGVIPEIDALSGTGALTLLAAAMALAGERRRRSV
jgi:hypothetical protein